jgi:hypothetical protein
MLTYLVLSLIVRWLFKKKKVKTMEHSHNGNGLKGLLVTTLLWAGSNIMEWLGNLDVAQIGTIATVISATVVTLANAPKAIQAIRDFFRKKNKQQ